MWYAVLDAQGFTEFRMRHSPGIHPAGEAHTTDTALYWCSQDSTAPWAVASECTTQIPCINSFELKQQLQLYSTPAVRPQLSPHQVRHPLLLALPPNIGLAPPLPGVHSTTLR
jgi:hypothetical protein